jgi:hypothetical protein
MTVPIWRVRTDLVSTAGNPLLSTMYFPGESIFSAADARGAVGTFWGALGDAMSETCTWTVEPEVASIDAASGDLLELVSDSVTWSGAGTLTGQPLPPANQALVRWRTASVVAGRQIHGRTFIPGMTENLNDDGTPNSGLVDLLNTAAALLIDGDNSLCVWSRAHLTAAVATSGTGWNQYAVLRSRRQ